MALDPAKPRSTSSGLLATTGHDNRSGHLHPVLDTFNPPVTRTDHATGSHFPNQPNL
jgi:hypothetical protein